MAKVYAVTDSNNDILETGATGTNEILEANRTIELEKTIHILHSGRRMKTLRDIILDKSTEANLRELTSKKYVLYGLTGILIPFGYICYITLIRVHDVVKHPEYWYEQPLFTPTGFQPLFAAYILINCAYWMNVTYIKTMKNFFILWIVGFISFWLVFGTGMSIWTSFGYQMPLPFSGFMAGYAIAVSQYITLWLRFPQHC